MIHFTFISYIQIYKIIFVQLMKSQFIFYNDDFYFKVWHRSNIFKRIIILKLNYIHLKISDVNKI